MDRLKGVDRCVPLTRVGQAVPPSSFIFVQSFEALPNAPHIMEAFCREWRALSPVPIRMRPALNEEWVTSPDCLGVVLPVSNRGVHARVAGLAKPVVNYSVHLPLLPQCINVRYAEEEIGELAADHLCEQGYRHFAFLPIGDCDFSKRRLESFREALGKRGFSLDAVFDFKPPSDSTRPYNVLLTEAIKDWLVPLPRALGVLSANDTIARSYHFSVAAIDADLLKTQALVGVDDDYPWWVKFSMGPKAPPLSSIRLNYEGMGQTCARCLREAISGERACEGVVTVKGAELIQRDSSGGFSSDDPLVAQLARWAAAAVERGEAPSMLALQKRFAVPRRLLAERFRAETGKSLREFILHLRVRRAARLLLQTDLTVAEIAQRCGFNKHADLTERFGKYMGCSPTDYRTGHNGQP